MLRHAVIAVLLAALLLGMGGPVLAAVAAADRDQPIHIEADSVEIDDMKGVSIYRGDVIYTQGSIRLEADTVHLFYDEQRTVKHLEAVGEPARFRQRPEGHDEDIRAQALRIEYYADPERLVLERQAHVWRDEAEFSGDLINYDVGSDMISATRAENENGRVRIVIPPQRGQAGE